MNLKAIKKAETHLCWVVDVQKGGVAGHHGSEIREGTQAVDPALGVIWFGALKTLDY